MKTLLLLLGIGLSAANGSAVEVEYQPENELLQCEVQSLESYGFEQMGQVEELVCANPFDNANFVVIENDQGKYRLGDLLNLELGANDQIIDAWGVGDE